MKGRDILLAGLFLLLIGGGFFLYQKTKKAGTSGKQPQTNQGLQPGGANSNVLDKVQGYAGAGAPKNEWDFGAQALKTGGNIFNTIFSSMQRKA